MPAVAAGERGGSDGATHGALGCSGRGDASSGSRGDANSGSRGAPQAGPAGGRHKQRQQIPSSHTPSLAAGTAGGVRPHPPFGAAPSCAAGTQTRAPRSSAERTQRTTAAAAVGGSQISVHECQDRRLSHRRQARVQIWLQVHGQGAVPSTPAARCPGPHNSPSPQSRGATSPCPVAGASSGPQQVCQAATAVARSHTAAGGGAIKSRIQAQPAPSAAAGFQAPHTWKVTTTSYIQPPFVFQELVKKRSKVAGAPSTSNWTVLQAVRAEGPGEEGVGRDAAGAGGRREAMASSAAMQPPKCSECNVTCCRTNRGERAGLRRAMMWGPVAERASQQSLPASPSRLGCLLSHQALPLQLLCRQCSRRQELHLHKSYHHGKRAREAHTLSGRRQELHLRKAAVMRLGQ